MLEAFFDELWVTPAGWLKVTIAHETEEEEEKARSAPQVDEKATKEGKAAAQKKRGHPLHSSSSSTRDRVKISTVGGEDGSSEKQQEASSAEGEQVGVGEKSVRHVSSGSLLVSLSAIVLARTSSAEFSMLSGGSKRPHPEIVYASRRKPRASVDFDDAEMKSTLATSRSFPSLCFSAISLLICRCPAFSPCSFGERAGGEVGDGAGRAARRGLKASCSARRPTGARET